MRICNKDGAEITSVDDWLRKAPPKKGAAQWKDYRSAKETAKAWFRSPAASAPAELVQALSEGFPGGRLTLGEAFAEVEIPLDNYPGETRNADLVVLGAAGSERLLVSIEAKADEDFGPLVGKYFDKRSAVPQSKVPARIAGLVQALFGSGLDEEIRKLCYQLLHATAAAIIEAGRREAGIAVFVVHEFLSREVKPENVERNHRDWRRFVARLAGAEASSGSGRLIGPLRVPGGGFVPSHIPLFVGKVRTQLS